MSQSADSEANVPVTLPSIEAIEAMLARDIYQDIDSGSRQSILTQYRIFYERPGFGAKVRALMQVRDVLSGCETMLNLQEKVKVYDQNSASYSTHIKETPLIDLVENYLCKICMKTEPWKQGLPKKPNAQSLAKTDLVMGANYRSQLNERQAFLPDYLGFLPYHSPYYEPLKVLVDIDSLEEDDKNLHQQACDRVIDKYLNISQKTMGIKLTPTRKTQEGEIILTKSGKYSRLNYPNVRDNFKRKTPPHIRFRYIAEPALKASLYFPGQINQYLNERYTSPESGHAITPLERTHQYQLRNNIVKSLNTQGAVTLPNAAIVSYNKKHDIQPLSYREKEQFRVFPDCENGTLWISTFTGEGERAVANLAPLNTDTFHANGIQGEAFFFIDVDGGMYAVSSENDRPTNLASLSGYRPLLGAYYLKTDPQGKPLHYILLREFGNPAQPDSCVGYVATYQQLRNNLLHIFYYLNLFPKNTTLYMQDRHPMEVDLLYRQAQLGIGMAQQNLSDLDDLHTPMNAESRLFRRNLSLVPVNGHHFIRTHQYINDLLDSPIALNSPKRYRQQLIAEPPGEPAISYSDADVGLLLLDRSNHVPPLDSLHVLSPKQQKKSASALLAPLPTYAQLEKDELVLHELLGKDHPKISDIVCLFRRSLASGADKNFDFNQCLTEIIDRDSAEFKAITTYFCFNRDNDLLNGLQNFLYPKHEIDIRDLTEKELITLILRRHKNTPKNDLFNGTSIPTYQILEFLLAREQYNKDFMFTTPHANAENKQAIDALFADPSHWEQHHLLYCCLIIVVTALIIASANIILIKLAAQTPASLIFPIDLWSTPQYLLDTVLFIGVAGLISWVAYQSIDALLTSTPRTLDEFTQAAKERTLSDFNAPTKEPAFVAPFGKIHLRRPRTVSTSCISGPVFKKAIRRSRSRSDAPAPQTQHSARGKRSVEYASARRTRGFFQQPKLPITVKYKSFDSSFDGTDLHFENISPGYTNLEALALFKLSGEDFISLFEQEMTTDPAITSTLLTDLFKAVINNQFSLSPFPEANKQYQVFMDTKVKYEQSLRSLATAFELNDCVNFPELFDAISRHASQDDERLGALNSLKAKYTTEAGAFFTAASEPVVMHAYLKTIFSPTSTQTASLALLQCLARLTHKSSPCLLWNLDTKEAWQPNAQGTDAEENLSLAEDYIHILYHQDKDALHWYAMTPLDKAQKPASLL